jgi:OmpA-OmpF porin, OOP family
MLKFKLSTGLFIVLAALLVSCSSDPKVSEFPITTDPQVEIDRVKSNLQQATNRQVDVLSPRNFASAENSLDKAIKGRANNNDQESILHNIAVSQAYLDRANNVSEVSSSLLKGPVQAREDALAAKANRYFAKEFSQADKDLKTLTMQIENNNTSNAAKNSDEFTARYREIELNSIKEEKLGQAKAKLDEAIKEGAAKLTPETLAWAKKQISMDESMIVADRHNDVEVNKASKDAIASSERLLKMVRTAKSSSVKNPEELAKQIEKIERAAARSEISLNRAASDLTNTKDRLSKASDLNQQLESKAWLDKEFDAAQSQFTKDEADVYKQGDHLVLRLKGLSFTHNKSSLNSNDFPLLAKVQKVIGDVGASQIVIEGHTDSSGDKASNDKLSTQRAQAVQNYLVANKNIALENTTATGLGDSKPIASNKTASGRAQNRRVDVIITAEPATISE